MWNLIQQNPGTVVIVIALFLIYRDYQRKQKVADLAADAALEEKIHKGVVLALSNGGGDQVRKIVRQENAELVGQVRAVDERLRAMDERLGDRPKPRRR